jgi:hypothetical protein
MASAASAPVFETLAGIRTIAESGRFKASSSLQVTILWVIMVAVSLGIPRFWSPDLKYGWQILLPVGDDGRSWLLHALHPVSAYRETEW